jgi:phosphoglycolate phosphatase-like HAD superfamily hydrolase
MIKAVVLDFDGVIVDSNRLKRESFFALFPQTEEVAAVVGAILSQKWRQSRFDILREAIERLNLAREAEIESLVQDYARRYNEKVQHGIAEMGLIPGVGERLAELSQKYLLFLNSGTYEPALRESIERLNISRRFLAAYGGPAGKVENLRKIFAHRPIRAEETAFVGDGAEDRDAARECDCWFVGVGNEFNGWVEEEFPVVGGLGAAIPIIDGFNSKNPGENDQSQNYRRRLPR